MGDSPKAKPLFWRKKANTDDEGGSRFIADGLGGQYTVEREQRGGYWLLWFAHDGYIWERFETGKDAQARAEVDWQERFAKHIAGANHAG